MKKNILLIFFGFWFACPAKAEESTNAYLLNTLIPLAQDFCAKVGMNQFTNISTNQIKHYNHYGFFKDRYGCIADIVLTNKFSFSSHTEKDKSEIRYFQQNRQKAYYSLNDAPVEKIKAVQSLLKQNKLNEKKALALARKYFTLLGHDEKHFHPPGIVQGTWISSNPKYPWGRLPAYTVIWYRNDVTPAQLEPATGEVYRQPSIEIEVSGLDSSLISYHRRFIPLGSDF